jgi:hypothetical protein
MFTGNFQERFMDIVRLEDVEPYSLGLVLDFIYTGSVFLSADNVAHTLSTANLLHVTSLEDMCINYLLNTQTPENCLANLQLAEKLGCEDFQQESFNFFISNFCLVYQTPMFLEISKEALVGALGSKDIKEKELDLFKAAEKWLLHCPKRLLHTAEVMATIRFGLMTIVELNQHVFNSELVIVEDFKHLCDTSLAMLTDYIKFPLAPPFLTRPRNDEQCLLTFDRDKQYIINNVDVEDSGGSATHYVLQPTMPRPVEDALVISCNTAIYVIGGQLEPRYDGLRSVASVQRFRILTKEWVNLTPMIHKRTKHTGCLLGEYIHVIGGFGRRGSQSNCEKYSIRTDTWERFPSYPLSLVNSACCCNDGKIFVSGGATAEEPDRALKDMYCISPSSSSWKKLSPMKQCRAGHGMCSFHGKIYVVGGHYFLKDNTCNGRKIAEIYDPVANQWSTLTLFKESIRQCQIFEWKNSLLVFGTTSYYDLHKRLYHIDLKKMNRKYLNKFQWIVDVGARVVVVQAPVARLPPTLTT